MNWFWRGRFGFPVLVVVVLVLLWEGVVRLGAVSPLLLVPPHEIVTWFGEHLGDGRLYEDIGVTLRRVTISFLMSAAIGIPIGALMGHFRILERGFSFPVDFSRSIPATALFPLFLVFFGVGEGPRIACAVYGASLIILMNSMSGIKQVNTTRIKAARMFGASGWKLFLYVLMPEALPSIVTGLRLGVSLAFVIIVLVEMFVGTSSGIGHRIIEAQIIYELAEVYGLILIAGGIGYLLNLSFAMVETKLAHYVGQ